MWEEILHLSNNSILRPIHFQHGTWDSDRTIRIDVVQCFTDNINVLQPSLMASRLICKDATIDSHMTIDPFENSKLKHVLKPRFARGISTLAESRNHQTMAPKSTL